MNSFLQRRFLPYMTVLLFALLCCSASFAHAAAKSTASGQMRMSAEATPEADTNNAKLAAARAAIKAGATPISVQHDGTDTLGAKLAFQLKETFNSGTLFILNEADVPKLQLLISSVAEFPSRPGVGSVYTVIWLYSERSTVFSSYLAHDKGVITPDDLDDMASKLAARTAGIVAKHSYLFNK